MTDVKNPKAIVMPAILLATSVYSLWFTWAIILGYFSAKLFCNFLVHNGKVSCIFIDWRRWKIHLHHWIMGVVALAIVWVLDYFYLPTFFAGFVCGIIIQDIYDYNDWYKIIVKNPDHPENKNP